MEIPKEDHGFLIGKGGNTRASIEKKSRVRVFIPEKASDNAFITIVGDKFALSFLSLSPFPYKLSLPY